MIIVVEHVCRNVCRSIGAGTCQCGLFAHVSADKTTAPHGGRCIQIPLSRSKARVGAEWNPLCRRPSGRARSPPVLQRTDNGPAASADRTKGAAGNLHPPRLVVEPTLRQGVRTYAAFGVSPPTCGSVCVRNGPTTL